MVTRKKKTASKAIEFNVEFVPIGSIQPSPENDGAGGIYNGVDVGRADFKGTLGSIQKDGIREPLQVTGDGFILSGHRRYRCATELEFTEVPIIRLPIKRSEMATDDYRRLLTEYNTQRDKTPSERMRELYARSKPKRFRDITAERLENTRVKAGTLIQTSGSFNRPKLSRNLQEFVDAIVDVVNRNSDNWPISLRAVHYQLLENPPLTNCTKGKVRHRYKNDLKSSAKLSDVLTRLRVDGVVPMDAIVDETRTETLWKSWDSLADYADDLSRSFAREFSLDLMADQPHHIEIVVEKNTIAKLAREVAGEYSIPVTVAKGKCSLPPRAHVFERWKASGKDKLIILVMADHDPPGIVISDMWHKTMIGDFGVPEDRLMAVRVAINPDQVKRFKIPDYMVAKPKASTYVEFVEKYGMQVYELDALKPDQFKMVLKEAIELVIDRDAYDQQIEAYEKDAGFLDAAAGEFADFMDGILGGPGGEMHA